MAYSIKETYYTIQGEGHNTGRPAVFLRFAGCNLWSGREEDRSSAVCRFCDTEFFGTDGPGGGKFENARDLAKHVASHWRIRPGSRTDLAGTATDIAKTIPPENEPGAYGQPISERKFVVCTGGEPLLQLDPALLDALHARGFEVAVETNGTIEAPGGIDWICVSPKAEAELTLRRGDELKLVYPQAGDDPARYVHLDFRHFYLQPMDGDMIDENTRAAIDYCLQYPRWKLSLQTHKLLGIP